MSRLLTLSVVVLSLTACAHQAPKTDGPAIQRTDTQAQPSADNAALASQVDSKDVKDYICYLCTLPQPERWEKAKALITNNHLIALCAFDKDHPVPENLPHGTLTIPGCQIPDDHP